MDRERVTRFGTLDVERTRLWVDEGVRDRLAGQVVVRSDLAGERVLGVQVEDLAGLDPHDGLAAAERPGILLPGWNESRGFRLDRHGRSSDLPVAAVQSYRLMVPGSGRLVVTTAKVAR